MKDGKMHLGTIFSQEETGASLYRLAMPNLWLQKEHEKDFLLTNFKEIPSLEDEHVQTVDIFLASRNLVLGTDKEIEDFYNTLRSHGAKVILDYDDYWVLPSDHHMYQSYKTQNLPHKLAKSIECVDHVFCTTSYLKERIEPLNANVSIVSNVPYPEGIDAFVARPTESEKVRFGWFGGAQHIPDVALMAESMKSLYRDRSLNDRYLLVCAGWNDNPAYQFYENVFTNGYQNKNYARINAMSVYEYGYGYNEVDVCYAPLRGDKFNHYRSELKCVEAGYMHKPLICSKIPQYEDVIKHNVNGLLVGEKESNAWYRYTKMLINDKDMRDELARNLHETIMRDFDYKKVFPKRVEIYKNICQNKSKTA
jgi:glycosyltransferase involved in cell wall biosynthesis